jgi:hypothetical protein
LHQLVEHLRNLMVARLGVREQGFLHLPDHEVTQLKEQVKEVSSEDLHRDRFSYPVWKLDVAAG